MKTQKYISLNEDVRKKKKDSEEEMEFERENERRKSKGLKLLDKGEVPEKNDDDEDIFLTETAMILADMIELPNGLSEVR
jgi:hypothetical protein